MSQFTNEGGETLQINCLVKSATRKPRKPNQEMRVLTLGDAQILTRSWVSEGNVQWGTKVGEIGTL